MELPNILILASQIPQTVNAGSLQLYRVLENYPTHKIKSIGPIDKEANQLGVTFDPFILPIKLSKTRFCKLSHSLNTLNLIPSLSSYRINKIIGNFKPDLVITLIELLPYSYAAFRYAKKNHIPLMTITMDKPGDFTMVYPSVKKYQLKNLKKIYQFSSLNLGVSLEMTEFIKKKFEAKCDTLYFCPPEGLYARKLELAHELRTKQILTIGYAGSLSLGYGDQIKTMLPFLEENEFVLNIYSHQVPDFLSTSVNYRGKYSQYEVWDKIKEECDIVILPYYFHYGNKDTSVYSTHFPTKLSEYLTLGMPVVVIGPEWATGMKWAKANPEAVLSCDSEAEAEWSILFNKLKRDAVMRLKYSEKPIEAQKRDFSPKVIKKQFLKFISETIKENI